MFQLCGQDRCLRFFPFVKTERNLCFFFCRSQLSDLTPFCLESTIFLPFSAAGPVGGGEERVAAACRHCAERESRRAVAALHGGGRTAELRSGPGEICCVAYGGMHSKGLVIHISDILPDPGRTAETWGLGKSFLAGVVLVGVIHPLQLNVHSFFVMAKCALRPGFL